MSIPCLHSPLVDTSVPSISRRASAKNSSGCCAHTFNRVSLITSNKRAHIVGLEAPAKIPGRGGIGNPPGVHRLQISFVLAPQFQIFQAGAVTQGVKGEVQDVVAFVVRQMDLQELQPPVDRFGQYNTDGGVTANTLLELYRQFPMARNLDHYMERVAEMSPPAECD